MKKILILSVFVITWSSIAMEYVATPEENNLAGGFFGLVDRAKDIVFGSFAIAEAAEKDLEEPLLNNNNASELVTENKQEENKLEQIQTTDNNNEPVKVTRLTKKNALKFGIGAVALITIGYTTYVLYKNGTLKKVADAMKKHPYITATSVTGSIALISGFFTYKYYYKPIRA